MAFQFLNRYYQKVQVDGVGAERTVFQFLNRYYQKVATRRAGSVLYAFQFLNRYYQKANQREYIQDLLSFNSSIGIIKSHFALDKKCKMQ